MKAVIPAGGYGTRLRPLTYTRPKALLPIAGKPMLYFIIKHLSKHGINEMIVSANAEFREIEEYFGDGSGFDVKLSYVWEKQRLGGVGCIKHASKGLEEAFLVILADNLTDINISEMIRFHKEKQSDATVALVYSKTPWLYGVPDMRDDNRIRSFIEKPDEAKPTHIATGTYIFEPQIMSDIDDSRFLDHTGDIFPIILQAKKRVYGFKTKAFWVDIGDSAKYLLANKWALDRLDRKVSQTVSAQNASIIGRVYIGNNTVIEPGVRITGPVFIGDDCHIKKRAEIDANTSIGSNVALGESVKIGGSLIYEQSEIGNETRIRDSIVAEKTVVERHVRINNSVIGSECHIGDSATIRSKSRIWPKVRIEAKSIIKGIIRHTYFPIRLDSY
ncbi:MAG: sugar phosphate nucleotidyltransferase [Candidatus Hodarchaeota archaeon]